jgi:hypothetical protein
MSCRLAWLPLSSVLHQKLQDSHLATLERQHSRHVPMDVGVQRAGTRR